MAASHAKIDELGKEWYLVGIDCKEITGSVLIAVDEKTPVSSRNRGSDVVPASEAHSVIWDPLP